MKNMKVSGLFEEDQKFPQGGKYSVPEKHDLEKPCTNVTDRLSNLKIWWYSPLWLQLQSGMGSQD